MKAIFLFIQLLFFIRSEIIYNLKELRPKPFSTKPSESFLQLDVSVEDNEVVVSYSDLSNDKYTDLILYEKKEASIDFYSKEFNAETGYFHNKTKLFSIESKYLVKNLFVTSLEPTNKVDFILTVSSPNEGTKTMFYISEGNGYNKKHEIGDSPILIADINGDRRVDVLYYANDKRQFVYFENNNPVIKDFSLLYHTTDSSCKNTAADVELPLTNKGNAFIDVDSNCRNDLLLTSISKDGKTTYIEIWHGKTVDNKIFYCLKEKEILKPIYGSFTLADFNDDGYIDLIFPHLDAVTVTILFNKHTPSFYWTEDFCEKHQNDTIPDIIFDFNADSLTSVLTVNLMVNETQYKFYNDPDVSTTLIRAASFDSESFPGLLAVIKNEVTNTNNVYLFSNILRYQRTDFSQGETIFLLAKKFDTPNPIYASFFDFDENGILDLFIISKDSQTNAMKSTGYFNNIGKDNFFVKGQTKLDFNNFYTSEIGTHYRFIATNNDGTRRMDFTYQLIQNSDLAMSLPYALAGIGRSNNYIENYQVVSSSLDPEKNREILTPIIPNSQLIITKKLEGKNIVWLYDLIVQPMEKLVTMVIIIAIILIVILVAIIILHMREKKEDKKLQENEKFSAWFA